MTDPSFSLQSPMHIASLVTLSHPGCTQIVLTEQQREDKKAAEAELAFARSELDKEVDPTKSKALREEVNLMEKKLDELLVSFEVCM